jgi:predicted anti-sigma-YlaC factor YlaD
VPAQCERTRQWVSAELDGRLSEFEHALLNAHLDSCPACSGYRASVRRFTDELRSAPPEQLEQPVQIARLRRRMPFRIAPAAAALAVAAVGLGSILASSDIRPGSAAGRPPEVPSSQRLSPSNGPVSLRVLQGLRRERIVTAASTVDTKLLQRPIRGGPVLR